MSEDPTADTPEKLAQEMREFKAYYQSVVDEMVELEQARLELYLRARNHPFRGECLAKPMTFKEIAEIFDVTQAAVMQKLAREEVRVFLTLTVDDQFQVMHDMDLDAGIADLDPDRRVPEFMSRVRKADRLIEFAGLVKAASEHAKYATV